LRPTDIGDPDYFHKVVDCQWACPAHTPVPEYIRLIAAGRYTDAYLVNWESNVFPGILGRTCDRPCEPACRRGRVEEAQAAKPEPVAICRLKRVAADFKDDITEHLPRVAARNGKRIACVGAGPASLTVARDLAPIGYEVVVFDGDAQAGGMIRSQIPRFRLPEEVIDEETGYVLKLGVEFRGGTRIDSMRALLADKWDAVFVGSGAPRGRDLDIPGRNEAASHIHIGIDWLSSVSFGHVTSIGKRVIVLGGGNTAMDCCRSSKRLGGSDVKVIVRSPFEEMKASPWEKEDAIHEGIPILDCLVPKAFLHTNGRLTGMSFDKVRAVRDAKGKRQLVSTGEPEQVFECDDVLVAVGQENAFPWIERDAGIAFDEWGMPVLDATTLQSSLPRVFFGGDAALGPKNIIWAVAQGHAAAISIDKFLHGEDVRKRPAELRSSRRRWASTSGPTTTTSRPSCATRCPGATSTSRCATSRSRSSSASTSPRRGRKRSAASTATWRRCSRRASASSATPASTSARPTASPSPPTATNPTCALACAHRRYTSTRRSTFPTRSRPAA
jgi:NADPH-dependent glutamate synthase beta subunit-like oxidoreductase